VIRAIARRVATASGSLLLVTLLVFCLIHLAPGDPLGASSEGESWLRLSSDARQELRSLYRLDQPLHRQYLLWLGDLLRGDMGRSFHDRRPVVEKIGERLALTVTLNALALALMLAVAVPLGTAAALWPASRAERGAAAATYMLHALPAFWAGLLLQMLFAVQLGWLPLAGLRSPEHDLWGPTARWADVALHLVLPVLCLSYGGVAYVSRFVRSVLLDAHAAEGLRAARARGLSRLGALCRHGFRQASVSLLTLAGFLLPVLVGGAVIVETVFALPGLGRLFVDALFQRDVPVLMGLTLLSGAATVGGILAADVASALADPRARRG
jgi:peptide/nickel transport system permease protein